MHKRYLENQVLAADPLGLVRLLYAGAVDAIRQAREHLHAGNVPERSNAVSKAMQIVAELQGSLDEERGGEVAHGLAQLYTYIQEQLIEANAGQKAPPLENALRILLILDEGWKEIALEPLGEAPVAEPVEAGSLAWTL